MSEVNIEKGSIRLNAKNSKDLSNRVKLKLPKYTNTKMGIGEFDDFIEIIKTNTSIDMLVETLRVLDDDKIKDKFFNLENYGEYIKDIYEKTLKDSENIGKDL